MKQQFICERRPKADPRNIVLGKNYRITFLTDRLVRFEYNESGAFVDEASQVIWYPPFYLSIGLTRLPIVSVDR